MAPPASHDHRVRFLDHAGGRLLDLSEKEKKGKRRKKEEKKRKKRGKRRRKRRGKRLLQY
jgi:hypothetical protein